MEIIIPEDKDVPFVIINTLDVFHRMELIDSYSEEFKSLNNNFSKLPVSVICSLFDSYVFTVPKVELIPENEDKNISIDAYKLAAIIMSVPLEELPYFKKMTDLYFNELNNQNCNALEYGSLVGRRCTNMNKSYRNTQIKMLKKEITSFYLTCPIWSSSTQFINVDIVTPERPNFKFNDNGKEVEIPSTQKDVEITYAGIACEKELFKSYYTEREM